MKDQRCLYCYQLLENNVIDFHERCSRKFFGTATPPMLEYTREQMEELAKETVLKSIAVTGVQPKLSLELEKIPKNPKASRLALVGLWGHFILKPPTEMFPYLPENEDLTMHLCKLFGITTADHSLIRLQSGELAYITRRFDRDSNGKLPQEDLCQLTETLTENKYRSSMENVGKHIVKYSSQPGFDLLTFFELSLFCFLTGNADMHLKNFALLTTRDRGIVFSPAYDLVNTNLAMPEDLEEMALTINGRKRKLKKSDFLTLAKTLKIPERSVSNSFQKFSKVFSKTLEWINISFLPENLKNRYTELIQTNADRLEIK